MRLFSRTTALAVSLVAAIGLAGCASGGGGEGATAAASDTLKIATVGISQDAALVIGEEQGIYAEHGVSLDSSVVANPPAAIAAVQSGEIDIAYTPTTSYFQAMSQGIELQIIAPSDGYDAGVTDLENPNGMDNTGLFTHPDSGISGPADLGGKTVAVPARNAQLEVTVAALAKEAGVDPTTINWVVLDFSSAVEALKSGNVDAAGLVTPFTSTAEEAGMIQISAPAVEFFGGPSTTGVWVTSPETIAAKTELIDSFIAAEKEVNVYANENLTESMTIAKEITGIELPVEEITPVYWVPELDPAEIESQAERIHELGYLQSPIDFTDAFYTPSGN